MRVFVYSLDSFIVFIESLYTIKFWIIYCTVPYYDDIVSIFNRLWIRKASLWVI